MVVGERHRPVVTRLHPECVRDRGPHSRHTITSPLVTLKTSSRAAGDGRRPRDRARDEIGADDLGDRRRATREVEGLPGFAEHRAVGTDRRDHVHVGPERLADDHLGPEDRPAPVRASLGGPRRWSSWRK